MLFTRKKDIIGIDIGSSSVKLVQLKTQKGHYQLINAAIIPLPSEAIVDNVIMERAAIVSAVQNLVSTLGITARNVACSISGNSVIIRKITLPAMTSEQLEEEITFEAEQYIPFDINDVNLDFQILSHDSADSAKMSVLLVASKKELINDYISVFKEAGFQLSVVDVASFTIQNTFEINHDANPEDVLALINIGASTMNINVVKSGITLFTRDVQMGANLYNEEIHKQMGLIGAEAESAKLLACETSSRALLDVIDKVNETITQEIRRSLEFYNSTANEERTSRIYLSGGCSKAYKLLASINDKLDIPVEMIAPFARIKYSDKDFDPQYLEEIGPLMAVSVGLAIRSVGDK
jgi:type IV pilus assembly protein PilM